MARYLGFDVGATTIGLATSEGVIASPRETIRFANGDYQTALTKLKSILNREAPEVLIFGYPLNMNGSMSRQAADIDYFIEQLLAANPHLKSSQIVRIDERRTTIMAHDIMKRANISWNKRKEKKDSLAAQLILEQYLAMKEKETKK